MKVLDLGRQASQARLETAKGYQTINRACSIRWRASLQVQIMTSTFETPIGEHVLARPAKNSGTGMVTQKIGEPERETVVEKIPLPWETLRAVIRRHSDARPMLRW